MKYVSKTYRGSTGEIEVFFTSDLKVKLIDKMGSDSGIVDAAIVTEHEGMTWDAKEKRTEGHDGRVIEAMASNGHGSPFEHAVAKFYVEAPIFVWREWHRHRIASYNEQSARYRPLRPIFYIPPMDRPMVKERNFKPMKPKFSTLRSRYCGEADERLEVLHKRMMNQYADAYLLYLEFLNEDLDPGMARDILPVGIYSACYVTMNARSLMNFLQLRVHRPQALRVSYPLYEIEVAAKAVETIFKETWPVTYEQFEAAGFLAP